MKIHSTRSQNLKPLLAALIAAFAPLTVSAAGAPAPDAGSILQQVAPSKPVAPAAKDTGLKVEQQAPGATPASTPFKVNKIRITGNTLVDTATLHALIADGEGKDLTLKELSALTARITQHYHGLGFALSRAIIPAQTISGGTVTIQVVEARYGKVRLDNGSRVSTALLQKMLSPLQSGAAIQQAELDRALLTVSDIPGVTVAATLKPGETTGTADLVVDAVPGNAVSGHVIADSYGNSYTGRARIAGTVNVHNPLHYGDVLSASVLSSGSGLNYGRISYESLINGQGSRVGASYSAIRYVLGEPLASLRAHGTAGVASIWARHPLVRSRDANLTGRVQYDRTQLRDRVDTIALKTDRHLSSWTLALSGDVRDGILSGGINFGSLSASTGRVDFDDPVAQAADAATAKTEGSFLKLSTSLGRVQNLGRMDSLYVNLSGQWASGNLDSSQKMSVGGAYSVRAYDVGVVSGDSGYQATIELRHLLGRAWGGQWQAVAFIDSAQVRVNTTTWATGANDASLSGAGLGLNWSGPDQWSAKATVATPIGSTPALVGTTKSVRGWVEIGKRF